jgi:branched-chain amino acid transport system ATP-binding protein
MLELAGVHCHYGKSHVLRDVSLHVQPGEIVSVIGPNAAGKTTTLRVIAGLKTPSAGVVRFDGADISRLAPFERVRRGLVLVPEGRQIFPKFTVLDNLLMGAYQRADRGALEPDLAACFELFPRLRERRTQLGGSLSGGEQQMLAIARAIGTNPKVLLLDELSMGLAPLVVSELYDVVKRIAAEDVSILVVEQFAHEVLDVADVAAIILHGQIQFEGSPPDVADALQDAYLGGSVST